MDQLRFQVLGPVEVRSGRRVLPVAGNGLTVLAGLLLSANGYVSVEAIAEWVWPGRAPVHPRAALHNTLSRLRHVLGPGVIDTVAGGYRLNVDAEHLDFLNFQCLTTRASDAILRGADEEASEWLREALALWRDPPLANVESPALAHEASRLTEMYLNTVEAYAAACLRLGRHLSIVEELSALVRRHPFRESMVGLLMVALVRSGRRADSLAVYRAARKTLNDELGIEPSQTLQTLHLQILRHEVKRAVHQPALNHPAVSRPNFDWHSSSTRPSHGPISST